MRNVFTDTACRTVALVGALMVIMSCNDRRLATEPVTNPLRIEGPAQTLLFNRTMRLVARDTAAVDPARVVWRSSDTLIATVDSSGLVRTRSIGAVTIGARRDRDSATFALQVGLQLIDIGVPVAIAGESNWASCVIATNGRPHCAGRPVDSVPQLRALPGATGSRFVSIASGLESYCALDTNGRAWCWGRNSHGQFGIASSAQVASDTAFPVAGSLRFKRLTTGGHSQVCAISATDDVVYCWGHNDSSQLGRGPAGADIPTPGPVLDSLRAAELSTSNGITCALDLQGRPWCWGQSSLDATSPGLAPAPRLLPGTPPLHELNVTESGACALDAGGAAWCWGSNEGGRLGTGKTALIAEPAPVVGGLRFQGLRANGNTMCGVSTDGDVYCWGTAPVRLTRGIRVRSLALGASFCVVTTDDRLYCS